MFGARHRRLGAQQQIGQVIDPLRIGGHTNAHGHPHFAGGDVDRHRGSPPQLLGQRHRLVQRHARQGNHELIAGETGDPTAVADQLAHPPRQRRHHLVADLVTHGLVDRVEAIDVGIDQRHRPISPMQGVLFEHGLDHRIARQPGLGIVRRGVGQPRLGIALRGDVGEDADVVGDRTARVADRRNVELVPEQRAVLAHVAQQRAALLAGGQCPPDQRALGLVVLAALQESTVAADDLVRAVAGHTLERAVDEDDRLVGLSRRHDDHAVARALDRAIEQMQLGIGQHAGADILDVGQHGARAPIIHRVEDPLHVAIGVSVAAVFPCTDPAVQQFTGRELGGKTLALMRGQQRIEPRPHQLRNDIRVLRLRGLVGGENLQAVCVEQQQRHRPLVEQQAMAGLALAQHLDETGVVHGIANAARQPLGVDQALHQIVAGAGLHGRHVHRLVAASGQHDERAGQALAVHRLDQVQSAGGTEQVIHQIDVVGATTQLVEPLLGRGAPLEAVAALADVTQHVADQDEIVLVVIDHKHAQRRVGHDFPRWASDGSRAMSIQ